jgi:hypothetical protein
VLKPDVYLFNKTRQIMKTYPSHIEEQANKAIAVGCKMTFESLCEMYAKKEAKQAKKSGNDKKWLQRELVNNTVASNVSGYMSELNRENAIKNLPSSLR